MRLMVSFMVAIVLGVSCTQPAELREYDEVVVSPSRVAGAFDDSGATLAPQPGAGVSWTAPRGWIEVPGEGMRRVRFEVSGDSSAGECTIVVLSGRAGGLAANVSRWVDELGVSLTESQLSAFLDQRETLDSLGGFPVTIVDFTALARGQSNSSLLTGIAFTGRETIFVKFSGSTELLEQNRQAFLGLCKSLRAG